MKFPLIKARNTGVLLLVCISFGLLLAGLWPFQFFPENNVQWIEGQSGIRFDKYGSAYTKEPLFAHRGAIDLAKPFTIDMEVRPSEEPSGYLPRILSAYDADGRELLSICQWRDELIVRILEEKGDFHLSYRETAAGGLKKGVKRRIVVRSDIQGLFVFVEGTTSKTNGDTTFSLLAEKREPAWLILGNSPLGDSPWRGDLFSLSIYKEALSPVEIESQKLAAWIRYDFSEGSGSLARGGVNPRYDIFIPSVFRAPKKKILTPPWKVQKYDRSFWKDVIINIIGFIPFGFAACAWLRKDNVRKSASITFCALLLGAGISLSIELLQVYLPTRDSSLTDVMSNVLGTYLGFQLFRTRRSIILR